MKLDWAELRSPAAITMLAIAVGFFLWGHEGQPSVIHFGDILGVDAVTHWELNFIWGAFWMAALPIVLLRFVAKESDLASWGLGIGDWKLGLPLMLGLSALAGFAMWKWTGQDPAMQGEYPLFGKGYSVSAGTFALYEACYLLFFAAGEISMRGLVLFGTYKATKSPLLAVAISTMPQIIWHLDKPGPEMLSAPVWGLAIGLLNLRLKSVWYMLVFHWLANAWLDVVIYYGL